jgi:hypothetical protein
MQKALNERFFISASSCETAFRRFFAAGDAALLGQQSAADDFYPIAIVDPIGATGRLVNPLCSFARSISSRAEGAATIACSTVAPLQLNALQILLFRQCVGHFNHDLADTVDPFARVERLHHIPGQLFENATKGHFNRLLVNSKSMELNFARFRA